MYNRICLKIIWVTRGRWEYKWDGEAKYLFLLNLKIDTLNVCIIISFKKCNNFSL